MARKKAREKPARPLITETVILPEDFHDTVGYDRRSHLYLLDTGQEYEKKRLYKIGFAVDVLKSFKDHLPMYGSGLSLRASAAVDLVDLPRYHGIVMDTVDPFRVEDEWRRPIALTEEEYEYVVAKLITPVRGALATEAELEEINSASREYQTAQVAPLAPIRGVGWMGLHWCTVQ